MAFISFTRETTLIVMMFLSAIFFVLEIVSAYIAGSIALIADAFHMLSDVMSLVIAFYAIKLAARTTRGPNFSYGWQRAEILGALVNGVFLLALCFTILIDAIERFVNPVHVDKPILVLIVGSAGLAMNLVGILLFHEHAHSHGGVHDHSHSHDHGHSFNLGFGKFKKLNVTEEDVEADRQQNRISSTSRKVSFQDGPLANLSLFPPQQRADIISAAELLSHSDLANTSVDGVASSLTKTGNGFRPSETLVALSPSLTRKSQTPMNQSHSASHQTILDDRHKSENSGHNHVHDHNHDHSDEDGTGHHINNHTDGHAHVHAVDTSHHGHPHSRKEKSGHLNMHGVFLHILGDALASIGVIISALIVQFAQEDWTYYADPFISVVICAFIAASTIPLVRSAAYILLQGVPQSVPMDIVRDRILQLEGIIDVHELHIWQLSDTKAIASVHVIVRAPFTTAYGSIPPDYMNIAYEIKQLLHEYGIHSTTVQPEFIYPKGRISGNIGETSNSSADNSSKGDAELIRENSCASPHDHGNQGNNATVIEDDGVDKTIVETACLLRCIDMCEDTCCPPTTLRVASPTTQIHESTFDG